MVAAGPRAQNAGMRRSLLVLKALLTRPAPDAALRAYATPNPRR